MRDRWRGVNNNSSRSLYEKPIWLKLQLFKGRKIWTAITPGKKCHNFLNPVYYARKKQFCSLQQKTSQGRKMTNKGRTALINDAKRTWNGEMISLSFLPNSSLQLRTSRHWHFAGQSYLPEFNKDFTGNARVICR